MKEAFIIGGGEIYKQAYPVADKIYLTRVHAGFDGDAFFPVIEKDKWDLVSSRDFEADEKNILSYSFEVWEKKK